MPMVTKTFEDLVAMAKGAIRSRIPAANLAEGTDYDIMARMAAAAALLGQNQAEWNGRQLFPLTADSDKQIEHGRSRGRSILPATKATGKTILTAPSGTDTQANGSALTAPDGTQYVTTGAGTIALPTFTGKTAAVDSTRWRLLVLPDVSSMVAGDVFMINGQTRAVAEVLPSINAIDLSHPLDEEPVPAQAIAAMRGCVVPVSAVVAGIDGNQWEGTFLTLSSPTGAIVAPTTVSILSGGADQETAGELAARVNAELAIPATGGSAPHIRAIVRAVEDSRIVDAVVMPGRYGLGTAEVFLIGPEGSRVVAPTAAALAQAACEAVLAPQLHLEFLGMTLDTPTNVTINYQTGPGFEPDWGGGASSSAFLTTAATTHLATRIYVTTDPSLLGCVVGSRVLLVTQYGARWKTVMRTVSAVGFSVNWYVEWTDPLPRVPLTADGNVYAAGPTSEAAVAAIEAVFDLQGPSNGAVIERIPDSDEAWPSPLYRSRLVEALYAVPGIVQVTTTLPASEVTFPPAGYTAALGKLALTHQ